MQVVKRGVKNFLGSAGVLVPVVLSPLPRLVCWYRGPAFVLRSTAAQLHAVAAAAAERRPPAWPAALRSLRSSKVTIFDPPSLICERQTTYLNLRSAGSQRKLEREKLRLKP